MTLYATWKQDAPATQAKFALDSKKASSGQEVSVPVRVEKNPGVIGVEITVKYDANVLEWVSVEPGEYGTLGEYDLAVGQPLAWFANDERADVTQDGVFVTLVFRVKDSVKEGQTVVTLLYDEDNVFNARMENVAFGVVPGTITVESHMPGDINGDGKVNNKDYMTLRRYIKYKDNEVVEAALDVNGDGKVNNKDYMTLRRYIKYKDVEIQ